jgi:ATP-dependent helicase/nuclease subunit A
MSSPAQKRELLPEQAAAAYTIDRHISVTAGPGSGKTTVLVERYLHILRSQKLNIDQIVAITFTNRAANEMRERLRDQLNQLLQTANEEDRRQWLGYKRTLDGAVITTIHGFCARLLREFPVEAGIDPQFLLLDEHRAAMLLDAMVEETLTEEFISRNHPEISRLILGVGRGRLVEALAQLYREVRGQGLTFSALETTTANSHATEADHDRALSELSRSMNDFLVIPRKTIAAKNNHAQVSERWFALRPLLQTVPTPERLAEYCHEVESFRSVRPQARGDMKSYVNDLDSLVWGTELSGRVPQICLDVFARTYALEMVNVLKAVDKRLSQEKQKLSALDFDDLELRALELLERPEVITRAAERYKFFVVDEFQDTNGLQKKLLERLALRKDRREAANLFIVGDRKQSIYGFRGADVDVFREMTGTLIVAGGEEKPLLLNFRSQPPLIGFFNHLFERLFIPSEDTASTGLEALGYVPHQASEAKREARDPEPLVELMITTEASTAEDDPKAEQTSRQLDAAQLAQRIIDLVESGDSQPDGVERPRYSDIALLFRAMTNVQIYETAFRRANIPYQTVLGRGFYEREEITDLIQLLRFLDNKTDEIALAAVLRSPLCGISDNTLLALRCAPDISELDAGDPLRRFNNARRLFTAVQHHRDIAYITDDERDLLDRVADLLQVLIARRHHYSLGDLLRFAVERSEFMTVIAANFDGAQRLANVQRLFTLAERFERSSGTHLIRDFVRYIEDFEAIGSRESEGQIDEAANAVRLMTIHQAKGLEFPVVIIPDLQRYTRPMDSWFLLDRHQGLTLRVPDGRGRQVAGCTFARFEQRHEWREQFESMRLLYVAATRAEDRLILSGTCKDLESLTGKPDTWLKWIWQSLDVPLQTESRVMELSNGVQVKFTLNLEHSQSQTDQVVAEALPATPEAPGSLREAFPLLTGIRSEEGDGVNRFSVTQLINYQRCPRQFYFDRILHVPSPDALAAWNDAEAPEPPANLTATLKGAVIHRFCETYEPGEDPRDRLLKSFREITLARQAELSDKWLEIDTANVIKDLLPLAQNYLSSGLFKRIETARRMFGEGQQSSPNGAGLWSELPFRLRRPLGLLSGTLDKLLITGSPGEGFEIEIVDFKTNRFQKHGAKVEQSTPELAEQTIANRKGRSTNQIAFDFSSAVGPSAPASPDSFSLEDEIARTASDYKLQMQAYALAVRDLLPFANEPSRLKVTLHFLEPNVEFHLPDELLAHDACERAIDAAIKDIAAAREPIEFPVRPARHCRMCNFLELCAPGREAVKAFSN